MDKFPPVEASASAPPAEVSPVALAFASAERLLPKQPHAAPVVVKATAPSRAEIEKAAAPFLAGVRAGGLVVELVKDDLQTMEARLRYPVKKYLRDESDRAASELAAPYIARLEAGEDCGALWRETRAAGHGDVGGRISTARDRLAEELGGQYVARFMAGASANYFDLSDELHKTARPDFREIADKALRKAARKRAKAEHGPNSGEDKRITQHNWPAQYFDKKLTGGANYKRRREGLTREILLEKWEAQGRRCALTKLPMMLDARKGSNPYNCSIDQILHRSKGGTYDPKNVQLVLNGVNKMRSNFEDADLATICRAIVETLS